MNPLTSATGLGPRTSFRQRPSAAVRVVSPVSIAIDVPGRKGLSLQQMASTLALDERGRLACSRCHVGRMHEACCESNAARKCRRRGKMHSAGLEWHSGCRRLLRGNGARRPTRRGRIRPHGRSRHKIRSAGNKDSTSNRRRSARRLERSQRTTASSWASVRALRRRKSSTRIAARHAGSTRMPPGGKPDPSWKSKKYMTYSAIPGEDASTTGHEAAAGRYGSPSAGYRAPAGLRWSRWNRDPLHAAPTSPRRARSRPFTRPSRTSSSGCGATLRAAPGPNANGRSD